MALYAIGDLQGCFRAVVRLLEIIRFDPARDHVWFTGDLVNRGPDSLRCLRLVKDLGAAAVSVLGNHDLHLLAVAHGAQAARPRDTLDEVLAAPDRDALLDWLRHRPLIHKDGEYLLVHAGLPPSWDAQMAVDLAREVETVLRGERAAALFAHMYGDRPDRWDPQLASWERLRFIINACTRMRYVDAEGRLDLRANGPPGTQPRGLYPWFALPGRKSADTTVVTGHWSALGVMHGPRLVALDSGCLWGRALTAVRLDDGGIYRVACAADGSPLET